jgi:hypothetical protein
MHRTRTILSSLVVVASALGAMGCSSSSSPAPSDTPVSFANDVMPIFQSGCTLSSECHGQPNNAAEENLYLGDNMNNTPAIIAQVYMGLVGVASVEDPSMPLVTAGSPSTSFLSHKVVGDQSTLNSDCAMAPTLCSMGCTMQMPCGTQMPYNGEPITAGIPTINNWIMQGAKNN